MRAKNDLIGGAQRGGKIKSFNLLIFRYSLWFGFDNTRTKIRRLVMKRKSVIVISTVVMSFLFLTGVTPSAQEEAEEIELITNLLIFLSVFALHHSMVINPLFSLAICFI